MKAMPISAVIMNVIPTPRSGAGMLEYWAMRSRTAATAVMASNQPITPAAACTYSCPYRAEVALLHEERAAEDGAVYRDKRQEDTERGIKRRSIFLHYHLHELCHRRDNGDKHYQREEAEVNLGEVGAEPRQGSGTEHVGLKQVVDGQGDGEHECDGYAQAERRLDIFAHRYERAHAKEVGEYHVVDKNRPYK